VFSRNTSLHSFTLGLLKKANLLILAGSPIYAGQRPWIGNEAGFDRARGIRAASSEAEWMLAGVGAVSDARMGARHDTAPAELTCRDRPTRPRADHRRQ
jgi:hypothetical protein